jgi:competence protein ComEA
MLYATGSEKEPGVIERLQLSKVVVMVLGVVLGTALVIAIYSLVLRQSSSGLVIANDPTQPEIAVEIRGEVESPGVYRFDFDARVGDLIAAAGGATAQADLSQVNLAQRLEDGTQVTVRAASASPIPPAADPQQATQAPIAIGSGLINVNTATQEELEGLPGIGPVLAARIVEWRTANGPFENLSELERVEGISSSTIEELTPFATTGS